MKNLVFIVTIMMTIFGCSSKTTETSNQILENETNNINEDVAAISLENQSEFVTIERSPCFGICPSYKLTIFPNYIIYNGLAYVAKKGEHKMKLSEIEFQQIREDLEKIDFTNLTNELNENISDIPYLIIEKNGVKKHFTLQEKERKKQLFQFINKLEKNLEIHESTS